MKIKLLFYSCCIFICCCKNSSEKNVDTKQEDSTITINPSINTDSAETITNDDLKFEMLTNMEQITFCLPYPSLYMKEDYEQNDSRAKHVFVSNNKKGKMILQGLWTDLSFEEIYKNHTQSISIDYPNAVIALSMIKNNFYVISWSDNNNIYYVKKWLKKDKDIVMAYFEYEKSEKEIFDEIIDKLIRSNPDVCK